MTIAAKHMDPVVGLDTHIILIPSPAGPIPTPLPHPYVGMVLDPMDYVPKMGATTYINGLPRGQAGTNGQATPPHIPMGGPFAKPASNESEIFMGSATVVVDGEPQSFLGLPVLSCQDIGMPAIPRLKKKAVAKSLVLPTTVVLCIPAGPIVMIGGPPTISMTAMAMKIGLSALKRIAKIKKVQRLIKAASDKAHGAAEKLMKKLGLGDGARNAVHKAICTVTGHPVDVATGKLFTDQVDLELAGPIPFKWERTWFSTSTYVGPLGHGWHHSYDMALYVTEEVTLLRTADGRHIGLPAIADGTEFFDPGERITLLRDTQGFGVRDTEGLTFRFMNVGAPNGALSLTKIHDRLGNSVLLHYDSSGRLAQIRDSSGRIIGIESDAFGRATALTAPHPTDPAQRVYIAQYSYDGWGDLVSVTDALGHRAYYAYKDHLLVQETNRNGVSFYFAYDGIGPTARCVRTWGDGGIYDHKLRYDPDAPITFVEDSLGYKTTFVHRGGIVIKTFDPLGNARETEYDESNRIVGELDELGQRTAMAYDERGNLTEMIGPDGAKLTLENGPHDLPVRAVDAVGGEWVWKRDEHGRVIESQDPLGHLTKYQYRGPWLVEVTDAAGGRTAFGYDGAGNVSTVSTPDGATTLHRYDLLGRPTAVIDPKGNVQAATYDLLGRITRVDEPDGNVRQLEYDPEGNLIRAKDVHQDVALTYQGMGRVASRTEAGTTVRFEYDTEEQLVAIVNQHGSVYRFKIGPTGDVDEESGFDGLLRKYTRDKGGRVTQVDRPGGRRSAYKYDAGDRVVEVRHSDGMVERFQYRLDGEMTMASNGVTTLKLELDVVGQLLKETQGAHWVESQYDALGQRIRVRSSFGSEQLIERNVSGEVTRVSEEPTKFEARFMRDQLGAEIERQFPGGIRSKWERDKLGRPIQHTVEAKHKVLRAVSYAWEPDDRLRRLIDALKGPTEFSHDAFGNLVRARFADGSAVHRVPDAVGNLFRSSDRNDRQYGPAGQLLAATTPRGVIRYAYDPEGNLVEKSGPGGAWRYEWNDAGMLSKVVRFDGSEVTFVYDALGRRVRKTYRGQTTHWLWDQNNPLHEWVDGALEPPSKVAVEPQVPMDAVIQKREAELQARLSQGPPSRGSKDAPITWLFEPDTFEPMAKLVGGNHFSIITDHLGTPVIMTDADGTTVWKAEIGIHGELREVEGDRHDCPFRWPGQFEDAETGLYYNRHRYYDPEAGAYISQDPTGLDGGLALYAYVSDPLAWMDPFGLGQSCYQTRSPSQVKKLRKEFTKSGGARAKFLKKLAKEPGAVQKYGKAAVKRMEKGKPPKGMVVHHKKPLFRGGTNSNSNLVLMSKKEHQKNFKKLHYY